MLAEILFEFAGEPAKRKYYRFELPKEVGFIKKGEIVVVEGINPGETRLGIFVRAFRRDFEASKKLGKKRFSHKKVIKKAHKNSLINLVKKRYELVKDLAVSGDVYDKYKKDYRNNDSKNLEEIRKLLMRNIIVAAEDQKQKTEATRVFIFGNMKIILADNVVIDLIALTPQKTDWVRPVELEKIAVDYINKMEDQKLLIV